MDIGEIALRRINYKFREFHYKCHIDQAQKVEKLINIIDKVLSKDYTSKDILINQIFNVYT